MNNLKALVLFGFGYLLLFAAVSDKGKHALRPWQAMTE